MVRFKYKKKLQVIYYKKYYNIIRNKTLLFKMFSFNIYPMSSLKLKKKLLLKLAIVALLWTMLQTAPGTALS